MSWMPDNYFALAWPGMLIVIVCTYSTVYAAVGLLVNAPLHSIRTVTDKHARPSCAPPAYTGDPVFAPMPAIADVHIADVSEHLWGTQ